MNSGMYAALSGNLNMQDKLDVIANNLANVNTVGFKRDRAYFEKVLDSVNKPSSNGQYVTDEPIQSAFRVYTDFTSGPAKLTGNTFNVALDGDGFFAVNTPQGVAYTRQGNFLRDKDGKLTTVDGYEVLGKGGSPITVNGGKVDIAASGDIFVEGTKTASLDVVDFPKPYQMKKIGKALFMQVNPQTVPVPAQKTSVMQGYVEDSNVSAIVEMVQMLESSRSFESCQRVVRSYDDMSGKAIELGKL
jgi:flagellar basal-body rod protein FlgF